MFVVSDSVFLNVLQIRLGDADIVVNTLAQIMCCSVRLFSFFFFTSYQQCLELA